MKKNNNFKPMNGYKLMQDWFDYTYEQQGVKPVHHALYCYLVDLCNRLGWKPVFGLPAQHTMERLGIGNRNTYKSALLFIEKMGAVQIVEWSRNQHTSTQVKLLKLDISKLNGNSKIAIAAQESACSILHKQCTSSAQAVHKHCTSSERIDKLTNLQTYKLTIAEEENYSADGLPDVNHKLIPPIAEITEAIRNGEEPFFNQQSRLEDWVRDYDASFAVWWLIYDKAIGEHKCIMEWYNLTLQDRVKAIRQTVKYTNAEPRKRFRKHPINWLQDKSWNDEIIEAQENPKQPSRYNPHGETKVVLTYTPEEIAQMDALRAMN